MEAAVIFDNLLEKCERNVHILPTNEWQVRSLEFRLVRGAKPKSLTVIEIEKNVLNRKADNRCYRKNITLTESSRLSCSFLVKWMSK